MTRLRSGSLMLALGLVPACIGGGGGSRPKAAEGQQKSVSEPAPAPTSTAPAVPRPEFVHAGEGEVDAVVRDALHAAQQQELQLVVYVGATWCEPCQAFHDAVERGELDQALAGVRFVEFDSDRDGQRLRVAGYAGRFIPRFVVPREDGRAGNQRMEGGIKGPGAVNNIMERLGPLLAGAKGT